MLTTPPLRVIAAGLMLALCPAAPMLANDLPAMQQSQRERELEQRQRERELAQRQREREQEQRQRERELEQRQREREREQRDRDRERERSNAQERTERIERAFTVGESGELDISNISGRIVVTGRKDREIRVIAIKRVRETSENEIARQLALLRVEIEQRGSRVEIRSSYAQGRNRAAVDYEITVPAGARVMARSISGDVRVTSVNGEVQVQSVSGGVQVGSADRLVVAKSVSGDVDLSSIASQTELSIGSVSGNVTARGIKGRGLEIQTVSGDLLLDDVTCDRASIRSVSGDVSYTGPFAKGGRYEFRMHSGDVLLYPTTQTGFDLRATSYSGEIHSAVPLTLQPSPTADTGPGRQRDRTVRGTFGDGSAVIDVTTFSGDITISPRR